MRAIMKTAKKIAIVASLVILLVIPYILFIRSDANFNRSRDVTLKRLFYICVCLGMKDAFGPDTKIDESLKSILENPIISERLGANSNISEMYFDGWSRPFT